jgi:hypothetical protein
MVNNQGLIIHKASHKKGKGHDYDTYKKSHPVTPKQVVSVFDLGTLGLRNTFLTKYHPCQTKREAKNICLQRKKSTTRFTPEKG